MTLNSPILVSTAATPKTVTVRCLLGRKHIPVACACLGSLLRHCRDPIALALHDDGSLTDADVEHLAHRLPGVTVVRRSAADARVADFLANYPSCKAWRDESNYALKVFDCIAFTEDDILVEIDSDILFFNPFSGLLTLPPDQDTRFLRDFENCYSVRSWNLLQSPKLSIGHRVNVGLIVARRSIIDMDRIEWFLSQPPHRSKFYFLEQTLWAMLAMSSNSRVVKEEQISIFRPGAAVTPRTVAFHFVAMHRTKLDAYLPQSQESAGDTIAIETESIRRCTTLDLAVIEAKRVLERSWLRVRGKR